MPEELTAPAREHATDSPRAAGGWSVTPWPYLPFRIAISVMTIVLFNQAVFAGQFLGGDFEALQTHGGIAVYTVLGMLVTTATAPVLRVARGPWWPTLASLGLTVLTFAQLVSGFTHMVTVHIPLGVAVIVLAALLVRWAWRPHPAATGRAAS